MNKLIILVAAIFFSTISVTNIVAQTSSTNSQALVEVLYFHATGRCSTCLAVDNNTQKFLEENFKTEMENGIIRFESVNFDEKEGRILADKYKISFSTLLIIKKEQQETVTDFTNEGFQYAEANPEKFKNLLIIEMQKNLN